MATLTHQRSLIHGLPDHLVRDEILPRACSWWDCRSIRAVSKGWRGALQESEGRNSPKKMMAAIHRVSAAPGLEFRVSVYDPELGSWEELPPIPGISCGAPMSARCVCVDGKLFVLGGRVLPRLDFLDSVFVMDLRACKKRWMRCGSMKRARAGFACLSWKGNIVVAGGQGEDELALSSVEAYSIDRDSWIELPELEIPRADCLGAVIESGILCVIGGFTILPCDHGDQQVWLNSMEILAIGRDREWEIVDSSRGSSRDVLQSCLILSGTLDRAPNAAALERALDRSERRWAAVNGKMCASERAEDPSSSDFDDEDERAIAPSLLLLGIGEGSNEYVTRCQIDRSSGRVSASLAMSKIAKNRKLWEEIETPFELVPTVSCCSITL